VKRFNLGHCVFAALACFFGMTGLAQAQEKLLCRPESGFWEVTPGGVRLSGALCSENAMIGEDFYTFDFETRRAGFAPLAPSMQASLRGVIDTQSVLFYADAGHIYGLSRENFRLVWSAPWQNVEVLSRDIHQPDGLAFHAESGWGDQAGSFLKVLSVSEGSVLERLSAPLGRHEDFLAFIWQPERAVVIERTRLMWWPRQGDAFGEPTSIALDMALTPESYHIDEGGLMQIDPGTSRILYYRFATADRTSARINATARVRGIGGSATRAMAVTSDMNIVRIVARMGSVLQNRYEAKYWRVAEDGPILLADSELLILDGSPENRAQSISTNDMTWKRMALIEYGSPGRLAHLSAGILTTVHAGGTAALIRWDANTGQKLGELSISALPKSEDITWKAISRVTEIEGLAYYLLVIGQSEADHAAPFAILDTRTMRVEPQDLAFASILDDAGFPKALLRSEAAFAIYDSIHDQWHVLGNQAWTASLGAWASQDLKEHQTAFEKWYGYCLTPDQCITPQWTDFFAQDVSQTLAEMREFAKAVLPDAAPRNHEPSALAWIVALLSCLIMAGVTCWRNGFWTKSRLEPPTEQDEPFTSKSFEILDKRNRRFISDRDRKFFLSPGITSGLGFRFLLSLCLGIGISIAVTHRYFYDDTVTTFVLWVVILSLPIFAAAWIILSWQFWNRRYLLRFGRMIEGVWLNCAKPNQLIAYTPEPNKSFELSRHQWKRVDFVPIVLFDPARPDFATQYTGDCSFTLIAPNPIVESRKSASTVDIGRLLAVVFSLLLCVVASQAAYRHAYPAPMSVGELNAITADLDKPFISACLRQCQANEIDCIAQCQHRQMRLIFEEAGVELGYDPGILPASLLAREQQAIANVREILQAPGGTCHEKADKIAKMLLWPKSLETAFWRVYGHDDAYHQASVDEVYQALSLDYNYLKALCDVTGQCVRHPEQCPPAPQCGGSVRLLKAKLCSVVDFVLPRH